MPAFRGTPLHRGEVGSPDVKAVQARLNSLGFGHLVTDGDLGEGTQNAILHFQARNSTPDGKPLPIDLPTALTLSDANPLDVRIADERLQVATAQLARAKVLWLPNVGVATHPCPGSRRVRPIPRPAARFIRAARAPSIAAARRHRS